MSLSYLVLDCETGVHNQGEEAIGEDKGHWKHPDNNIVMWGGYDGDQYFLIPEPKALNYHYLMCRDVLVGHNIRFDLHYLLKTYPWFEEWLHDPEKMIWDTQLVEYLLTGQDTTMATLDSLSEKYGGTLKDDRIKDWWDQGIMTENMPEDVLADYLEHDVMNTHLIFKEQLKQVRENNMEALVRTQLKALVATLEMEHNGMCFDKEKANWHRENTSIGMALLAADLLYFFTYRLPDEPKGGYNVSSNKQLSLVLFGGKYDHEYEDVVLDEFGKPVVYKSGKRKGEPKTKKFIREVEVEGYYKPKIQWVTLNPGVYQVGDNILKELLKQNVKEANDLIECVLKYRALQKDCVTYYEGYSKLAWPEEDQWFIHGNLNHCITATGRLSSSKPNLQNLSGKER